MVLATSALLSAGPLVLLGACSSQSVLPADVEAVELPIVGGADAATCAWPTVVLVGDGCTGTLVHPQVVVTAAHCVDGTDPVPKTISFGENTVSNPYKTVKVSRCAPSPKYTGGDTDDVGYCLLAEAVTNVPIVPIMAPCEASVLKAGSSVVEVGFGQSAIQTSGNDGFGVKRLIAAKIQQLSGQGQINVTTGTQNGEYYGDSGGPIFFQMPDKTWRFIGDDCCSADIVQGSNSARISTYISAPSNLAWLASATGVDLSLCHDGSNWNPSALCAQLPTTPDKASGGWAAMCSTQNLVSPQATCTVVGGSGGGGSGGNAGSVGTGGGSSGGSGRGGAAGSSGSAGMATAGASGNVGSSGGGASAGGAAGASTNGGSNAAGGSSARGGAANTGGLTSLGGTLNFGGSSGGRSGAANQAGSPATTGTHSTAGTDSNSGCSCGIAGRNAGPRWHVALAAFALASLRRRRSSRS